MIGVRLSQIIGVPSQAARASACYLIFRLGEGSGLRLLLYAEATPRVLLANAGAPYFAASSHKQISLPDQFG